MLSINFEVAGNGTRLTGALVWAQSARAVMPSNSASAAMAGPLVSQAETTCFVAASGLLAQHRTAKGGRIIMGHMPIMIATFDVLRSGSSR